MDPTKQRPATSDALRYARTRPDAATFDALKYGLWRRVVVHEGGVGGALLNTRVWNASAESGEPVGDCRRCGYHLRAQPTTVNGHITWYTAECTNCGHEIAAPNGEILIRSGRHSEQPPGFAEGRPKGRAF